MHSVSCLRKLRACVFALVVVSSSIAQDHQSAAIGRALSQKSNYSWIESVQNPGTLGSRPMIIEGQAEKDGVTAVTLRFGDRTIHGYLKGNKAYVTSPDSNWKSIPEMEEGESPGQFLHRMVRSVVLPARQIAELTKTATSMQIDGDSFTGELGEEGAKALIDNRHSRIRRDEDLKDTGGNFRIWTKDGVVNKYEFTVRGKKTLDGKEVDLTRTTVVEIKDVGTTTVTLPDRAKEKLGIAKQPAP